MVIPKHIFDALELEAGDYLGVEKDNKKIVFEPKAVVDKELRAQLAESMRDFKEGRSYGPYNTAEEAIAALHSYVKEAGPKRSKGGKK